MLKRVFIYINYTFVYMFFRVKVTGIENLKNLEGIPKVFAANHISFWDSFVILSTLPFSESKNMLGIAKEKYLKYVPKYLLNSLGILSVGRDTESTLETSSNALLEGKSILIFPEGTRSRITKSFKRGFAMMAKVGKALILPIAIQKKGNIFSVCYLPPVEISKEIERTVENVRNNIISSLETNSMI